MPTARRRITVTTRSTVFQTLDPLGGVTRTQYDSLDQVVSVTDPIGVTTAYWVDGLGNAGGTTLSYAHDALNRLTQISNRQAERARLKIPRRAHRELANFSVKCCMAHLVYI